MSEDPSVTRSPAVRAAEPASPPTRARRRGAVPPGERRELAAGFGARVWSLRAWAGVTQRELAERAGLADSVVRDLEHGRCRPSDATCRKLAAALYPQSDDLTVAVADLELQEAAGGSLRPRHRRKPPRKARQRLYARAREVLAERRAREPAALDGVLAAAVEAVEPAPADPWPGARRPGVRS